MLTRRETAHIEPGTFIRRLLRDVDPFFEEAGMFARPARVFGDIAWAPALEVSEQDRHLRIRLDLPGVKREEVAVTITDEGLRIEGERTTDEAKAGEKWRRTERAYGRFVRTVPLPDGIDPAAVTATFESGVLEVTVPLPAATATVAPRKVEIGEGKAARTAA
jgi:HSP20 family protein